MRGTLLIRALDTAVRGSVPACCSVTASACLLFDLPEWCGLSRSATAARSSLPACSLSFLSFLLWTRPRLEFASWVRGGGGWGGVSPARDYNFCARLTGVWAVFAASAFGSLYDPQRGPAHFRPTRGLPTVLGMGLCWEPVACCDFPSPTGCRSIPQGSVLHTQKVRYSDLRPHVRMFAEQWWEGPAPNRCDETLREGSWTPLWCTFGKKCMEH